MSSSDQVRCKYNSVAESSRLCPLHTLPLKRVYKPAQVNPKLGFEAASAFLHKLVDGFPFCPNTLTFLVSNPEHEPGFAQLKVMTSEPVKGGRSRSYQHGLLTRG